MIWIKFRRGLISTDVVYLCLCYVLPTGTSRQPFVAVSVFDRLLNDMSGFVAENDHCSFIICGDLNARTRQDPDYVSDDNFNFVPLPDDYVIDDISPRASLDNHVLNQNGTLLLDFCKQTSLRIINGRCGSDTGIGKYTCTTTRGQSLVDYFIATPKLFHTITAFSVGDPNILSDHSVVSISFKQLTTAAHNNNILHYHNQ